MGQRRILFLCTHNPVRSRMAERLPQHAAGDRFEAMSAPPGTSGTDYARGAPIVTRPAAIIGAVRERPDHRPEDTDLAMMHRALLAAEEAAGRGEVPVGAVVARGDEVLAVAANEREAASDPTAHAELLAIRRAAKALGGWRLSGCTLYATLEPCPMCAGAAHAARLPRIVYAAPDPKAGYAGTLHNTPADKRLNHTTAVESGVLQQEAADLLRAFFKNRRKRPGEAPKPPRTTARRRTV